MALTLLFLPLLLPEAAFSVSSAGKARKRSVWKPSLVESMDFFVDVKESSLDLQKHLEAKADELVKKVIQLQPHVVVLCDKLDQLGSNCSYYACVRSNVYYSTTTLMEAVDICVKSTFVFGLSFPSTASSTWTFLQRAVYGITTRFDHVCSRVLELLTDIGAAQ